MKWIPWVLAAAAAGYCLYWLLRVLTHGGRTRRKALRIRMQLEQVWAEQEGVSPEHPIMVDSPSVVEPKAESANCPNCEHPMRVVEHTAETRAGRRLRVTYLRCDVCGDERALFFALKK